MGEGLFMKTKRLVLRKWTEADAGLYEYAKDPKSALSQDGHPTSP